MTRTSSRHLIVHGKKAPLGRFPYFTTLDRECAGALIAPDIVLTAGHCKPHRLDDIGLLHVGTYYFDYDRDVEAAASDSDYDQESFGVAEMIRHPKFKRKGDDEFRHDFTVLKLERSSQQLPVKINRDPQVPYPDQEVVAMGLGDMYNEWAQDDDDTDLGPIRPKVLQEVSVNYLPNEECRLASDDFESYTDPPNRIGSTHLCTFVYPNNDRDACSYDSGGPVIVPAEDGDASKDLLVALVSWGIGCADPVFPAVNARVSSVSDWIDEQVCRLSENPPADFGCNGPIIPTTEPLARHLDARWTALFVIIGFCTIVLFRVAKGIVSSRIGNSTEAEDIIAPDMASSDFHFQDIKRRETSETCSLISSSGSEDDLIAYGSTSASP